MFELILLVSGVLFFVNGCLGYLLTRKNVIVLLVSLEFLVLGGNLNFVVFSFFYDDLVGQLYVLLFLCIVAAETAIGLSMFVSYYRVHNIVELDLIKFLKR